jgi:thioredoxin-like negative regulator of GroEL
LQIAVRVQPDFWRAQYELGAVLIQKGDTTAAVEHLTLATKGDDRDSASAAQAWLQRLKH